MMILISSHELYKSSHWSIPQIYYVGLLAGKNDIEAVEARGDGREINRHNFDEKEIAAGQETEVVKRLVNLIRFRNQHPAFEGDFTAQAPSPDRIGPLLGKWC
ncbi:MAG: hypothetical protein ACLT8L_02290 [Streptococcus salivarius]